MHSGTRVGDLHLQVEAHDHVQDEEEVDLPPAKAEDPKSGCFRASGIVSTPKLSFGMDPGVLALILHVKRCLTTFCLDPGREDLIFFTF